MTNLVHKGQLIAALERTLEGLQQVRPLAELVATMGQPQSLGLTDGAHGACTAILEGLLSGNYDARDEDILAECAVVRYTEEDEDTEDMDDIAPEEEPGSGVLMLPPGPSSEEREELYQWAANNGFIIKFFTV